MDGLKEYKKQMVADSMFQQIIKSTKINCPKIPQYNPNSENTEEWKAKSLMKEGYALCFYHITGLKLEDINYE